MDGIVRSASKGETIKWRGDFDDDDDYGKGNGNTKGARRPERTLNVHDRGVARPR